ncbi:hypothetical protein HZC20_01075 [Candidatus Peregrinibacteria bacterium]|nr:hypothetical protein [Candidatus Peregrinibacteria bacterium]
MKIAAIAINTFREAIKDRILYSLLFFALLMIAGSVLLSTLTLGEQAKIIKDVGLAAISIFGLLIAIFVGVAVMTVGYMLIIWIYAGYFDFVLLKAILLIFFQLMVITAVAIMFSTFSTPALSGLFTLGVYVIGHLSGDLKVFGGGSEIAVVRHVSNFLYYLLPNLSNFNIKGEVVYNIPVSWKFILFSITYGILYIFILLLISTVIFNRRDFK